MRAGFGKGTNTFPNCCCRASQKIGAAMESCEVYSVIRFSDFFLTKVENSVLSRKKGELNAIAENAEVALNQGTGNKARGRITASKLQNSPSLSRVREEKILAIKQQLAKGTYDLDERLDVALDRILQDITT